MLKIVWTINRARKFSSAARGLLTGLVLAVLAVAASAQCTQWDGSGEWNMEVTSGPRKGYVARVSFRQAGKNISGTVVGSGLGEAKVSNGSFDGDKFGVYLLWDGKDAQGSNVEIFAGMIGTNGLIKGTATLFGDRSGKAEWSSSRAMKCSGRSIRGTGRAPTAGSPSVPHVIAFNKPGQPAGTRTLSWDAGPGHPYAELWVKVGNEDEIFVVEQGKGTRQVTVEPGKEYLYILTDAGKRLATAAIKLK